MLVSDAVAMEAIKTGGQVVTAICSAIGIWFTVRSRKEITSKLSAQDTVLATQTNTINKLELQTNGLQTALLLKTEQGGIEVGKIIGTHETNLRRDQGEKN